MPHTDLPLNLGQDHRHEFHAALRDVRIAARRWARELPVAG
ncbi:hypothetical protein [Streptomyces fragilis]|uniref:Uncharacterized protein n=1 Tax=Streptomyces fragilis TaxID=67301 RepID=A0ABV2YG26_9ACTN|nr:hypothetical protein [Streptomyces fragilis]